MKVDNEYVDEGGKTTVPLMPSTVTTNLLLELSTAKLLAKLIVGVVPNATAGEDSIPRQSAGFDLLFFQAQQGLASFSECRNVNA